MLSAFRNDSVVFCIIQRGPQFLLWSSCDSAINKCNRIEHLLSFASSKQNNSAQYLHGWRNSAARAKIELSKCTLLTYFEPLLRSCQLCSYLRTSQHFMEPEGSLPCSQEPSTGPHPQPNQSSPYYHTLTEIHFNIIHQPTFWSS
jgi:hypothetical protein